MKLPKENRHMKIIVLNATIREEWFQSSLKMQLVAEISDESDKKYINMYL